MYIKIYISLIFLLIYNFFIGKLELFIMFYSFVVMHELSHMIIALLLNVDIIELSLLPVGLNAKYTGEISLIKEFLISIAGPIASLFFAYIYDNKIYFIINICILIFNIIPIYPLDGGRILRVILKILFGDKVGKNISTYLTNVLLIIFLLFSIFIAAYLKNFIFLIMTLYMFKISKKEIHKEKIIDLINYLQIEG